MGRTEPLRPSRIAVCLLLLLLPLSACTQLLGGKAEIHQKRRFLLVVEPIRSNLTDSKRPYSATVQLQTFSIAGAYNQSEIVSRSSPYELIRNSLFVWGQRPREMITDVIEQYLKNAQLFTRLVTDREILDRRPDYILTGSIQAIERFDSGDRWFARILLSMQLVRQEDTQVIWRGEITEKNELEVFNADMEYTVQAMSEILRRRMEFFIRQLDSIFLNMQRPSGERVAVLDSTADLPSDSLQADVADTLKATHKIPSYYELIPGKLAPE